MSALLTKNLNKHQTDNNVCSLQKFLIRCLTPPVLGWKTFLAFRGVLRGSGASVSSQPAFSTLLIEFCTDSKSCLMVVDYSVFVIPVALKVRWNFTGDGKEAYGTMDIAQER